MALDKGTSGYLEVLAIGLIVAFILILVFSYLRPRVPDVYEHRALLNLWKSHNDFNGERVKIVTPRPGNGFFTWLSPVFSVTEDEIVAKLGLDAAMFLRYLSSSFYMMAVLALLSAVIIMPAYGTGSEKDNTQGVEKENLIQGLLVISLANVPPGDPRLWATLVMEYITAVVVLFFMARDFKRFADLRRLHVVSENPSNYALVVYDIPEEHLSVKHVRDRFELIVPGQIAEVILVRQCGKANKLLKQLDKAVSKRELAEHTKSVKGTSPNFRPGACGCLMCHKPKVDAIDHWESEQDKLSAELAELGSTEKLSGSAIIVFTNRRACALLAQANVATESMAWTIARAPEPEGVHWPAFNVPALQVEPRMLFVFAFVVMFTLSWTIISAFVVGLASLSSLSRLEPFSWLEPVLEWSPALVGLIEGVLPTVVLAVLISLIPALFRFLVGKERITSLPTVEKKTRDYFYVFTIYGTFFSIALGGSILNDINAIIEDPTSIIDSLAQGTPKLGLFFATYIIVQTFIPLALQLSGIVRVILRAVLLKLAKTERQSRKARSGGSLFQYFKYYAQAMLMSFLGLMYTSLSPIVTVTSVLYFGYALLVFRYVLCFMSYSPWSGAGELYPGAYWGTMGGLILKQIVTIAIIALNRGAAQAILCVIPLLVTIIVSISVNKRYRAISDHGSLHDMYEESSKLDEIPPQYHDIYQQPAGRVPQYTNLNGVADHDDVYPELQYEEADTDGLQSEHHDEHVGYVPDRAADRVDV